MPSNTVYNLIQLSNYDKTILSTGGSVVIPASEIVDLTKAPIVSDVDYNAVLYGATHQIPDNEVYELTLNTISGAFEVGEIVVDNVLTPTKSGVVLSWDSPVLTIVATAGIFVDTDPVVGTSGSGAVDVSGVEQVFKVLVEKVPMVRLVEDHPTYDTATNYVTGDVVKYVFTPAGFGLKQKQVVTGKVLNKINNSRQLRYFRALSGNGPITSAVEPGSDYSVWEEVGSYIPAAGGNSRGYSTVGSYLSYPYRIVLDSTVETTDVDQVDVIVNFNGIDLVAGVDQNVVTVNPISVDGSSGLVYLPLDTTLLYEEDEQVLIGDGVQNTFTVSYPAILDSSGIPTTNSAEVVVEVDGVPAVCTINDPISGSVTLTVTPSVGEVVTISYNRHPRQSAGDLLTISYFQNETEVFEGVGGGPVINSVSYSVDTKTLTINGSNFDHHSDLDPTRVVIEGVRLTGSNQLVNLIPLNSVSITGGGTVITVKNLGGIERNSQVRVSVVKASLKSNFVWLSFPVYPRVPDNTGSLTTVPYSYGVSSGNLYPLVYESPDTWSDARAAGGWYVYTDLNGGSLVNSSEITSGDIKFDVNTPTADQGVVLLPPTPEFRASNTWEIRVPKIQFQIAGSGLGTSMDGWVHLRTLDSIIDTEGEVLATAPSDDGYGVALIVSVDNTGVGTVLSSSVIPYSFKSTVFTALSAPIDVTPVGPVNITAYTPGLWFRQTPSGSNMSIEVLYSTDGSNFSQLGVYSDSVSPVVSMVYPAVVVGVPPGFVDNPTSLSVLLESVVDYPAYEHSNVLNFE